MFMNSAQREKHYNCKSTVQTKLGRKWKKKNTKNAGKMRRDKKVNVMPLLKAWDLSQGNREP